MSKYFQVEIFISTKRNEKKISRIVKADTSVKAVEKLGKLWKKPEIKIGGSIVTEVEIDDDRIFSSSDMVEFALKMIQQTREKNLTKEKDIIDFLNSSVDEESGDGSSEWEAMDILT